MGVDAVIHDVQIKWERPPESLVRDFKAAVEKGWQRIGLAWWRKFLPLHFTTAAYSRYRYQPRTVRYAQRKERWKHHSFPLVWTGELKRSALTAARIKATSTRVTIRFGGGTRALNFSGGRGGHYPPIKDEMTRVIPEEMEYLTRIMEDTIAEELNQPSGKGGGQLARRWAVPAAA